MSVISDLFVRVGADIGGALSGLSRVESAMGALGTGAGRAAGMMGTAFVAGGALIVGAAGAVAVAGTKMAGDLEQSVANISTIKPDIDASAVFNSLNEMQTRIPQTAAQLGDSLNNVFQTLDVTTAQGLQLTERFAKGAVAAQTDAATFGGAIMGVMNAYGTSVEDASHISDVFFNTIALGVVTGQELASSLGPVTQSAKAAGVSIDEMGALIAGVTRQGGPAAQNINNLNNMFQKITTKDAQKAINDLGVKTIDAQGNFLPIMDVMTDLKGRLGGMTESAKALALQGIFPDAQARLGAQTIMDQLDFVKGALRTNAEAIGVSEAAYKKMSSTFNSQTALLGNTFNAMLTTVGAAILPHLTPLITALAQSLPGAFAAIQAAAAPVVSFLQGSVIPVFASIAGSIGKAFETGDIGTMFTEISTTLAAALPGILTQLQAWGQAFVDWISPYVPPMLLALGQLALGVFAWITEQIPGILTTLAGWGVAFVDWVAPMIPGALAALAELIGGVLSWIGSQVPAILATLQRWGEAFIEWVSPMIPPALAALGELALGVLGWIGEQAPGFLAQLQVWGLAFLEWIPPAITQMLTGLGDLSLAVLKWMTAQAPTFMERLIAEWIPAFVQWAIDVIPKLMQAFNQINIAIGNWITSTGPVLYNQAMALGVAIMQGIIAGIDRLSGGLISKMTSIATSALQAAEAIIRPGSPSKTFQERIGEPIVQGIIAGIDKQAPELYSTMTKLAKHTALVAGREFADLPGNAGLGDMMPSGLPGGAGLGDSFGTPGASPFGLGDVMTEIAPLPDALGDIGQTATAAAATLGGPLDRALMDLVPATDQATAAVQRLAAQMRSLPLVTISAPQPAPAAAPAPAPLPGNAGLGDMEYSSQSRGGLFAGATVVIQSEMDAEVYARRTADYLRAL